MKKVFMVIVFILFSSYLLAVVANPSPFFVTQRDGQKIKVVRVGDEWNNRIETMGGYSIEKNETGWWIYSGTGHIKPGGLTVGIESPEGHVKKHYRGKIRGIQVRCGKPKPLLKPDAVTTYKLLVILVKFSDQTPVGSTVSGWSGRIFLDTVSSVTDYFNEVSYGQFSIIPAVESHGTANDGIVGWVNVGYPHPDTQGQLDSRNKQLTKDAVLAADPYVDFSSFDSNSDGYLSVTELGIIVVAAGYEAAFGVNAPAVWGHKWSLDSPYGSVPAPTCDGVKVAQFMGTGDPRTGGYMQYGEWHQSTPSDGHLATIGVMVHELGHDAFGLPDLYDTLQISEGIGGFGLMGSGGWGQKSTDAYSGTTPVHMCGWSKAFCGFLSPKTPPTGGICTLRKASSYKDIFKFPTSDSNQYVLVENRQLSGYDEGLWYFFQSSGGGLAVWHVDMSKLNNGDNDDVNHKLVDLEEADGNDELDSCINRGDKEDLFYQGNNDSFTDTTIPDSKLYDGSSTGISMTSISASGSTMTMFSSYPGIPRISVSCSRLNFGSDGAGNVTGGQQVLIRNSGEGTLNWTVTCGNSSMFNCVPSSGTNAGLVTVTIDASGLPPGTYTGTMIVSDPNASNSPQTLSLYLYVYNTGAVTSPFGVFATPLDQSTVSSSIPVTGWALDDIEVDSLKIYRDPAAGEGPGLVYIGDALFVEGLRPDVEQAFPGYPQSNRAGWGYMMLTNFLPNGGNGTYNIYATAVDKEGNTAMLGKKTITVDNANAVKPFGAIDLPIPGSIVSGSSCRNSGWVLTPQPNSIPTDGSTIDVLIDGVSLGNPNYNIYRDDIATLFPGYLNSGGAHAYLDFDTTTYTSGLHTIAWIAIDSVGNSDGIGSRYFRIVNTGGKREEADGNPNTASCSGIDSENTEDIKSLRGTPVHILRGTGKAGRVEQVFPDNDGIVEIKVREMECFSITPFNDIPEVSGVSGYMAVGEELRPLPVGMTLDSRPGKIHWLLGPGFLGEYRFVFIARGRDFKLIRRDIIIKITPKFGSQ